MEFDQFADAGCIGWLFFLWTIRFSLLRLDAADIKSRRYSLTTFYQSLKYLSFSFYRFPTVIKYIFFLWHSPRLFLHVAYLNAPICIEYQWFEFAIQQSLNIYEKIHFLEISISFTCVLLTFTYSHFFFVQNNRVSVLNYCRCRS